MRGHDCGGWGMSHTWRLRAASLAAALLLPAVAWAQAGVNETVSVVTTSNASGAGSCTGGGCTGGSVATIQQNQLRKSLTLDNSGGSIVIGYRFGTGAAAIGTPPTESLAAGAVHYWPAGSAPSAAIVFIAASGTPAVTVREGQ
jgi:hypothetical protein